MREMPRAYERYRHFKGGEYQILALAKDAESGADCVVYQGLYAPYQIWVRPLEEFMSDVEREKYPNATQRVRFMRIEEEAINETAAARPSVDPGLLRFLDADTNEEKLSVLSKLHDVLTPALLTPIELSLGMEPQEEEDTDIRYRRIRDTLQYKQKYEKRRGE